MIQSLTFTNRFGRSLRCILGEPERSNFAIIDISGLGPGNASVNIHDIATADGGYFGSARFSARSILLKLQLLEFDLNGNYIPIEDVRHLAYEFFAPKTPLQILVNSDRRSLVIDGYVESNEPNIFQSSVTATVSILCPGYYFKMASEVGSRQSSVVYGAGMFQFPFSNESLTKKLIQFGEVEQTQKTNLYYDGDAENGFELEIVFDGRAVNTIRIQNTPIGNSEKGPIGFVQDTDSQIGVLNWVDTAIVSKYISITISKIATKLNGRYSNAIYSAGNRIVIRSMVGKKAAFFIDDEEHVYNILDTFDHLDWLKLYPGYNEIEVQTNNASIGHFAINANYEALYTGV